MNLFIKLFKNRKFIIIVKIFIIIFLLIVSLVNGDVDTVLKVITAVAFGN